MEGEKNSVIHEPKKENEVNDVKIACHSDRMPKMHTQRVRKHTIIIGHTSYGDTDELNGAIGALSLIGMHIARCTLSRSNWPNNEKKAPLQSHIRINNPLLQAQSPHRISILLSHSLSFSATFTHFCVIFSGLLYAECILFVWPIEVINFCLCHHFFLYISPNHLHVTQWINTVYCVYKTHTYTYGAHAMAFPKPPQSTTRWWRIFVRCTEMKIRLNAFWKCTQRYM